MTTSVAIPADLLGLADTDLGASSWAEVTQDAIDGFAEATVYQWIHCRPGARPDGPFGGRSPTLPHAGHGHPPGRSCCVERGMAINYGLNRVFRPGARGLTHPRPDGWSR
jgi:hypothetical protein